MTEYPNNPRLSEEELLAEIDRLADELGDVPSLSDMKKYGEYGQTVYYRYFDSWSQALNICGYEPKTAKNTQKITKDDLVKDLQRVYEIVDRPPRARDVKRHGEYSRSTVYRLFDSWGTALQEAGFEQDYAQSKWIPTGVLVDEMLRVMELVGRVPYQTDMDKHGEFSHVPFERRFGSWGEAHEHAGLPPRKRGSYASSNDNSGEYGSNWKGKRRETLVRDRWCCQDCGMSYTDHQDEFGKGLHVHHIIPILEFDSPEDANFLMNLVTLCEECHTKWEEIGQMEIGYGGVTA